jgi:hypothetical protein
MPPEDGPDRRPSARRVRIAARRLRVQRLIGLRCAGSGVTPRAPWWRSGWPPAREGEVDRFSSRACIQDTPDEWATYVGSPGILRRGKERRLLNALREWKHGQVKGDDAGERHHDYGLILVPCLES